MADVLKQIERIVAEWVVSGLVPQADAPKVIRLLHGGFIAGQTMGKPITVLAWCEQYAASLRKLEAMSPDEYAATKRWFNKALRRAALDAAKSNGRRGIRWRGLEWRGACA